MGVDSLVVLPADYTALGQALKTAYNAGVKIVNADSKVVEDDQKFVSCFITADYYSSGYAIGKYLSTKLAIGQGMEGLFEISIISLIVACIVSLIRENGGINLIISGIKNKTAGKKGAEFGIALLVFLVDLCTANNTVAIVLSGPIAKEIGDESSDRKSVV